MVVQNSIYYNQLDKRLEKAKRDANTNKLTRDAPNAKALKKTVEEI